MNGRGAGGGAENIMAVETIKTCPPYGTFNQPSSRGLKMLCMPHFSVYRVPSNNDVAILRSLRGKLYAVKKSQLEKAFFTDVHQL